jgi:ubiquinone/menaquinone biosynthesis C-methylase UbiE
MAHVCPWWFVRSFDNPIRRMFHDPERIFGASVRLGMHVLDVGCGAGFNTEGLARLVGPEGLVVAVDLQPHMLAMTKQRLESNGLLARAEFIQSSPHDLGLGTQRRFGFATAFWMVHEVPDVERLFEQLRNVLGEGAPLLVAEPKLHVSKRAFESSVRAASRAGFKERERPAVALSHSVLLVRS